MGSIIDETFETLKGLIVSEQILAINLFLGSESKTGGISEFSRYINLAYMCTCDSLVTGGGQWRF